MQPVSRRASLVAAGVMVGAALAPAAATAAAGKARHGGEGDEDVSAVEDLMREHGVLRRILVIYRETASRLAQGHADFDAAALGKAAELFRTFGEDYHERRLEEQHIFPALKKRGGQGAALVPTLLAQHDRGRQITAYVRARCAGGKIGTAEARPLGQALEAFARMYETHTAFEDTIAFQAWRKALSKAQLKEAGEQFEDIERAQFKGDGFDIAVAEVAAIEQRLGLNDLARYTAPSVAG